MKYTVMKYSLLLTLLVSFNFYEAHAQTASPTPRSVQFNGAIVYYPGAGTIVRGAGATVKVEGKYAKHSLVADEEGKFEVTLPVGVYQFTIDKKGFERWDSELRIGDRNPPESGTTNFVFILSPAPPNKSINRTRNQHLFHR